MTVSYREMKGPNGLLAMRSAFVGNSMHAEYATGWPRSGRLDSVEEACLDFDWRFAQEHGVTMYVVYSYATPIAWAISNIDGGIAPAYIVDQKFSRTTSNGQGYVRMWINHHCPKLGQQEVSA